jgi:carbonic anhydrase/acetyltransferase-like protein (isoleucine patch superfamily)
VRRGERGPSLPDAKLHELRETRYVGAKPCPIITRHPDGSFRAHNCTIVGDVKVSELASFWFGAVVRGDVAPVTIGRRVNVQDNAVVHCDTDVPNVIEDDVVIGHGAIVHGMRVGAGTLVGMGSTLLSRTKSARAAWIAAGAVVRRGWRFPMAWQSWACRGRSSGR